MVQSVAGPSDPPGLIARSIAPNGNLLIVQDVAAAYCSIVDAILQRYSQRRCAVALSGGPTARRCYEYLATYSKSSGMDWTNVAIFISDERCVPIDHPDSNSGMVRDTLVSKIGKIGVFHPMDCVAGPEAYSQIISDALPLDLIHLGMGPDGHTASLFAGSSLLGNNSADKDSADLPLVALSSDPRNLNPHDRMTLTLPTINASRHVVFTVSGKEKLQAMKSVMAGDDIPALQVRAGNVVWIVDEDAAP
ncbi:MAG: 6-phosphogluconolactonase [Acidimicrobiales bacterium]